MSVEQPRMREIDFQVVHEEYTRYLLEDRTLLKVKIPAIKMIKSDAADATGYPNIGVSVTSITCAIVPEDMKKNPSLGFDPTVDRPVEIEFSTMEEVWQEYRTEDGYRVLLRPVVTKILKYEKYNQFREPVYGVGNIQQILDIKRVKTSVT